MIVDGSDGTSWLVHSTLMEPGDDDRLGLEPMDIHIMKKVRA